MPPTQDFRRTAHFKVQLAGTYTQARAGSVAVNADLRWPTRNLHSAPLMVATGQRPLIGRDRLSMGEVERGGISFLSTAAI
jgi:hypothetical protein